MIIHKYETPPAYNFGYKDIALEDYEVDYLIGEGIDEAWYYYGYGHYEGGGVILMKRAEKWDVYDMGHCSCYGPTEYIEFDGKSSLIELWGSLSKELKEYSKILFEKAGYTPTL